jgi:hypothetical protein
MMDGWESLDNRRREGNRCVLRSFVHSQVSQTDPSRARDDIVRIFRERSTRKRGRASEPYQPL